MTGKIKTLPPEVIAAIAAGEIVERPSVVVKELVENALDAGATTIEIELEDAGLGLIRVSDNGEGIPASELPRAIERHTTSKIASLEDLTRIRSFGFRGEALASIASVSEITIESRISDAVAGTRLQALPDQSPILIPVGRAVGTTVTVQNLFFNLPARLKFIRNTKKELRDCIAVVMRAALSHPLVRFTLTHHHKNLLTIPSHFDAATRFATVLNHPPTEFYPIHFEHTLATISGSLGLPQIARKTKQDQYLFINGRPVSHPALNRVIKEAYGTLLDPRQEPIFVLNVEIMPDQVDVNVHPRKEHVVFINEAELLIWVKTSISQRLTEPQTTYPWPPEPGQPLVFRDRSASALTSTLLKELTQAWRVGSDQTPLEINQVLLTYLVTATPAGLVVMDQHAAHERILYEQFKATYAAASSHQPATTRLEPPVTLSLSPPDSQLLEAQLEVFATLGFEIEPFGSHTFKISQVPTLLADRPLRTLFQEILEDLQTGDSKVIVDSVTERTLAYLACRSAVKAGDYLTPDQRRSLFEKLAATPNHTTCPHGRPTLLTMTKAELEQMFKRR